MTASAAKPKGGKTVPPKGPTLEFPDRYSGFIIVRLSPELPLPSNKSETLLEAAKELGLSELEKILTNDNLVESSRLIRSLDPRTILQLEKKAGESVFPPLHSLTSYWRVDARHRFDKMKEIDKQFKKLKGVDTAYREFVVSQPTVNADNNPFNQYQGYLDAAPLGIDARWAWMQPNGEGAGIGLSIWNKVGSLPTKILQIRIRPSYMGIIVTILKQLNTGRRFWEWLLPMTIASVWWVSHPRLHQCCYPATTKRPATPICTWPMPF